MTETNNPVVKAICTLRSFLKSTIFSQVKREYSELGKLVMERRGNEGIREFAKKIGVSPATLSRVENGKLPDLETFSKICDKLDLDPTEILQLGKNPRPFENCLRASNGGQRPFQG